MANLAIVGTHSTNGVAAIHSHLLRETTVKDLAEMFPERFNNKTNGVTPRRWLQVANPASEVITDAIGDGWITDLSQLTKLRPLAEDSSFRDSILKAKHKAKDAFRIWLRSSDVAVDTDAIFDCHVKRIHEYKRQLLNVLRSLCFTIGSAKTRKGSLNRGPFSLRAKRRRPITWPSSSSSSSTTWPRRSTGSAGSRPNQSCFPARLSCELAERLIPASDVSNQISTAGYEASGTSNMKFMMNGALRLARATGPLSRWPKRPEKKTSSSSA